MWGEKHFDPLFRGIVSGFCTVSAEDGKEDYPRYGDQSGVEADDTRTQEGSDRHTRQRQSEQSTQVSQAAGVYCGGWSQSIGAGGGT